MEIIVTGATGKAGRQVVKRCIENHRITKVIVLTPRAVSGEVESHPKVEVIMQQDFFSYSDTLLHSLRSAQACIWTVGRGIDRINQCRNNENPQPHMDYMLPLVAARTFCHWLVDRMPHGTRFRFVVCGSGHAQNCGSFPFVDDLQRYVSEIEEEVLEAAYANFEVYILRPTSVSAADTLKSPLSTSSSKTPEDGAATIDTTQVCKAMVAVALGGWKSRVIEHDSILKTIGEGPEVDAAIDSVPPSDGHPVA